MDIAPDKHEDEYRETRRADTPKTERRDTEDIHKSQHDTVTGTWLHFYLHLYLYFRHRGCISMALALAWKITRAVAFAGTAEVIATGVGVEWVGGNAIAIVFVKGMACVLVLLLFVVNVECACLGFKSADVRGRWSEVDMTGIVTAPK